MDSLIRKACELGEKTAHCSVEVIVLNAGDDRSALLDALDQKRIPDKPHGHSRTCRTRSALVEGGQRRSVLEIHQPWGK